MLFWVKAMLGTEGAFSFSMSELKKGSLQGSWSQVDLITPVNGPDQESISGRHEHHASCGLLSMSQFVCVSLSDESCSTCIDQGSIALRTPIYAEDTIL